ncbi:putative ribonuclease H-like domain-containing protein [Tanacetum coccineum]
MAGSDDEIPPPPPPPQTPTQQAPHTVSTIKLPILKKGEYDIWAMKMEHYLSHTDYPIWEVIQKGNGPVSVSTDTNGVIKVLPPKTAEEILARERERKARTTLLMALPEDHLAKFHKMTDAKDMWDAIKSRFGGNDESKKMQKYILKQQFEGFSVSNSEGLHKGYDRFQSLLSQLEIHGAGVSTEDANQKFLRSLPSSWSQVSLVMRTKPGVDNLSIDDLYNNLRVFESDIKGSTGSSSSAQNVAFVSSESTSSTNDVSTAYGVSTSSGYNSQRENSSSYTDELMYSFFANQSSGLHLDHEDLEQLDEFDLEEMDLKCQVAMISMRLKKFYKMKGRSLQSKEIRSRRRDAGNTGYRAKDNGRRPGKQEEPKALVTLDGEGVDWTGHAEDEQENFALMAYSNSGSDTEEKIRFMEINLDDKIDVQTYHKKLLAEAVKEKEELKTKLENFQSSSKGLSKLLNSQMSTRDKSRLGYGDQVHNGVLSYENEVFQSVFDSRSSDVEDSPVHDRFANVEGMHAVPPPMTGNYMPSGPDREVDDSIAETLESVPKQVVVKPKVVSQPKVWFDAPIIEEYKPSPKADKRDWNGLMSKRLGLGYEFTKKACFVCGSFSHPIRDCDFHEKRLAKQVELNKKKVVLTRTGRIPVNTASHNFNSQAISTSAARKVNAVRPIVNQQTGINAAEVKAVSAIGGKRETAVSHQQDNPQRDLKNKGILDSGCSRHRTGNKAYLAEYQDYNGGPVAFGGSKGYINGKGKIKTGKLDFEDVCFVKELQHFNLFSVSQMCDKKNKVLFTDTECLVLSSDFKLPDENQVLLRIPRQNNMYSFNLENIVPSGGLACLIAKATVDESNKWHRRLGHVNFKNLNKLVKGNLVRGLPLKIFQNDHTCVACQKGKQHKASCKAKIVSSISQPLQLLHMDLFGPTSVKSINYKTYCLVITDDFSRFSWVFFLRTKDETSGILKDFIRQTENQLNQKVKTIRCDNGTELKNKDIIEFCGSKGIKREYSNAKTPQQNEVAERKNMTLIEAARTMLADSFLPNTFWAEAVSTACYVLNRVLVTKPQNKTPYELITGTQDNIDAGNSEMQADPAQDYFVLPIYSSYTLTVKSSEANDEGEKSNKDTSLKTNEEPVDQEDQAFLEELEKLKRQEKKANDAAKALRNEFAQEDEDLLIQAGAARATSTNTVNTVSTPISTVSPSNVFSTGGPALNNTDQDDSQLPALEDIYDNPKELLQFRFRRYGFLVDLPYGKKAIGTKWVYRNKKDQRGVVVRNKPRLVAQGYRQEEGIDYDEVFAPMTRIEAIRIFLAFASYMGFIVYQIDVKSAFLYDTIDEEVYVSQPPGFVDPKFPKKSRYRRGTIDKTLFIKKEKNDIMLVQVYVDDIIFGSTKSQGAHVAEILKKFNFASVKTANTLIETQKLLTKDEEAADVDVYLYRSMIGSLMYLTASRPDIMFAVCACSRFHVTPKTSHLNDVKRIFSDYAGANLERKSTTRGCQFLGRRLISWQCKKQTIMATYTTEAEYVTAANCYGLRATYGAELVSAASLVNTARPTLSTAQFGKVGAAGKVGCGGVGGGGGGRGGGGCQHKVGACRQKFVLLVTVTTVVLETCSSLKTVNERAKFSYVDSKAVVVTEASIKSFILLLHDVDGTACLTNEAIFQNLALMGKVVKFSGKVTLLFDFMLVPHQASEGEGSEQPTEPQPTPSPTQPSTGEQPHPSHDSPLLGGPTSDRAKGGMTLEELYVLCTNLSNKVLALEASKDA